MDRLDAVRLAPVALKVKNAIEAKSAMCLKDDKPPVGTAAYKLRPNGRRFNYTTYLLKMLPRPVKKDLWKILGDGNIGGKACKVGFATKSVGKNHKNPVFSMFYF